MKGKVLTLSLSWPFWYFRVLLSDSNNRQNDHHVPMQISRMIVTSMHDKFSYDGRVYLHDDCNYLHKANLI